MNRFGTQEKNEKVTYVFRWKSSGSLQIFSVCDNARNCTLWHESPMPKAGKTLILSCLFAQQHHALGWQWHNISLQSHLILVTSGVALCVNKASVWCHYLWVKNKPKDTLHPTRSLHMATVSHVFPHLGHFLPHGRHIKRHTVYHNFCQMTQCYVILVLFQLESTAWHQGGQQLWKDLPHCYCRRHQLLWPESLGFLTSAHRFISFGCQNFALQDGLKPQEIN